jgi:hypothetical protein
VCAREFFIPFFAVRTKTVRDSRTVPLVKRAAPVLLAFSLALVLSSEGCKRKIVAPKIEPPSAQDIEDAIATVSGPKRSMGMVQDLRGAAATRLGEAGPAAQKAVPALEKLAKDKKASEETRKAAEDALAKIRSGGAPAAQ